MKPFHRRRAAEPPSRRRWSAAEPRSSSDLEVRALQDHYELLSCREQEVMALVVSGLLNKQVGFELGISEITVKAHRGRVMRKMEAKSLPDLVNMAARLGVAH